MFLDRCQEKNCYIAISCGSCVCVLKFLYCFYRVFLYSELNRFFFPTSLLILVTSFEYFHCSTLFCISLKVMLNSFFHVIFCHVQVPWKIFSYFHFHFFDQIVILFSALCVLILVLCNISKQVFFPTWVACHFILIILLPSRNLSVYIIIVFLLPLS